MVIAPPESAKLLEKKLLTTCALEPPRRAQAPPTDSTNAVEIALLFEKLESATCKRDIRETAKAPPRFAELFKKVHAVKVEFEGVFGDGYHAKPTPETAPPRLPAIQLEKRLEKNRAWAPIMATAPPLPWLAEFRKTESETVKFGPPAT